MVGGPSGSGESVTPGQGSKGMAPGHGGGVKEDIDAIFGEDLDEELREKAETVFEAAVNARLSEMNAEYSDAFNSQLAESLFLLKLIYRMYPLFDLNTSTTLVSSGWKRIKLL